MAKLTRKTARVFGENAVATGTNPQIGQFGSGKKGTYEGTGDIDLIQSLDDGLQWSNGWIDAVTPNQQFPPLPEMTGVHKVLSYQSAYLLQEGIAEYDADTTYYTNSLCKALDANNNLLIYQSKVDNNTGNAVTNTTYWTPMFGFAANQQLSNLASEGEDRLHALKGYLDEGELLTDKEGIIDVSNYAHSTYDSSKVGSTGTPLIINGSLTIMSSDGAALNFSGSNYLKLPSFTLSGAWKATFRFNLSNISNSDTIFLYSGNNSIRLRPQGYIQINTPSGSIKFEAFTFEINKSYLITISFDGTNTYSLNIINFTDGSIYTHTSQTSTYTFQNTARDWYIGSNADTNSPLYIRGILELKGFSLITGGSSVNASQTGTDTYTISGNTITIPYSLSKTGSKVVDSAYRTQVASVYNTLGYSPYYTINEGVNFTLPQGELYGMYENFREKAEYDMKPDYSNTISPSTLPYTAPSDGYLFLNFYVTSGGTNDRIIQINGIDCLYVDTSRSAATSLFLNKGDIVSIKDGATQVLIRLLTFVPLKGV